jgi:hypothetical protein
MQINLQLFENLKNYIIYLRSIISKEAMNSSLLPLSLMPKGYFITDKAFYHAINKKSFKLAELEEFVIKFYSDNNWAETEKLFSRWQNYKCLEDRKKAFEACIAIITNSTIESKYIFIVTIPTLINQLEGILRETCVLYYKKFENKAVEKKEIIIGQFIKPNNKKLAPIDSLLESGLDRSIILPFVGVLDLIFKDSKEIDSTIQSEGDVYNLFRHKISHGENWTQDYSTIENLIRLICSLNCSFEAINHIRQKLEQ